MNALAGTRTDGTTAPFHPSTPNVQNNSGRTVRIIRQELKYSIVAWLSVIQYSLGWEVGSVHGMRGKQARHTHAVLRCALC
jgi:hypothetical protein